MRVPFTPTPRRLGSEARKTVASGPGALFFDAPSPRWPVCRFHAANQLSASINGVSVTMVKTADASCAHELAVAVPAPAHKPPMAVDDEWVERSSFGHVTNERTALQPFGATVRVLSANRTVAGTGLARLRCRLVRLLWRGANFVRRGASHATRSMPCSVSKPNPSARSASLNSKQIPIRMKRPRSRAGTQPPPRTPGLTSGMVRAHATRVFHDIIAIRPLTPREWRLVEDDLVRRLENDGW